MNLLHMKYAIVIAETNSINKAAELLYVGQPTLSRAVKELESSLGVTIFERSAKGMFLTPDGETFIRYAKTVLRQVDAIEEMFKKGRVSKKRFSVSVPRASYIAEAFAAFSKLIGKDTQAEIFYKETNSMRTLRNVLQENYKLGIVRYAENYDKYYKAMMEEKGLEHELITKFRYVLLMSGSSPLAAKENITFDDLKDKIEIAHADPYVPSLPFASCRTTPTAASSSLNAQASLSCFRRIRKPSCGSPPFRRSFCSATALRSASAKKTAGFTRTCLSTAGIIRSAALTTSLLNSLSKQKGTS